MTLHAEMNARRARVAAEMARGVRMGTGCGAHTHREQVPIESHHIWPLGMGGPDVPSNRVTLCANAHLSVHALLDLYVRYGDEPPWEERRHFGPVVRRYARTGWHRAGRPTRA